MEELVKTLAKLRAAEAAATQKKLDLQAALNATPDAVALAAHLVEMAELHIDLVDADAALREAALAEHMLTGAKHLFGGVQIKMFTVMTYDPDKAKSYCINHGLQAALKLDAKVFERAVPALGLDWVSVEQEPRATIPTDLSAYVPAPEPVPVPEVAVIESVPA